MFCVLDMTKTSFKFDKGEVFIQGINGNSNKDRDHKQYAKKNIVDVMKLTR